MVERDTSETLTRPLLPTTSFLTGMIEAWSTPHPVYCQKGTGVTYNVNLEEGIQGVALNESKVENGGHPAVHDRTR